MSCCQNCHFHKQNALICWQKDVCSLSYCFSLCKPGCHKNGVDHNHWGVPNQISSTDIRATLHHKICNESHIIGSRLVLDRYQCSYWHRFRSENSSNNHAIKIPSTKLTLQPGSQLELWDMFKRSKENRRSLSALLTNSCLQGKS